MSRRTSSYDIILPRLHHLMLRNWPWQDLEGDAYRIRARCESVSMKKATEQLSRYFQREFGYDFAGYSAHEQEFTIRGSSGDLIGWMRQDAWLWVGDLDDEAYGYLTMMWVPFKKPGVQDVKTSDDVEWGWELGTVWLHPYKRNRGHLSKLWPRLEQDYPGFTVSYPWSPAMKAFLSKHERFSEHGNIPELL